MAREAKAYGSGYDLPITPIPDPPKVGDEIAHFRNEAVVYTIVEVVRHGGKSMIVAYGNGDYVAGEAWLREGTSRYVIALVSAYSDRTTAEEYARRDLGWRR
jgi:hypothetical protein